MEQAAFSEIGERLDALGVQQIEGLLADLGVSSEQFNDPERGMSFRAAGPIDMRMDGTSGETALELIERLSQDELADVIYELGEERASRRIARCIKQAQASGELGTTLDLRRAVVRAVGPRRVGGVDPATRTFQALRMQVNGEIEQLRSLLGFARERLSDGGIAALISFHSLEDRLVKREFVERSVWERLTPKPLIAAADELEHNPRSRSAKLRVGRRLERRPGRRMKPERVFLILWMLAVAASTAAFVLHLALRVRAVELGYELGRAHAHLERLREVRHVLEVELGSHKTPERVDFVARTLLGMSEPSPERIRAAGKRPRVAEGAAARSRERSPG